MPICDHSTNLARRIQSLRAVVAQSRKKAEQLVKQLSDERARAFQREVVGETLPPNPDDSVGAYSHDFSSFLYLETALDYLESAVESADAAPTPDMRTAYAKLSAIYRQTLSRSEAMTK